MTKLNKGFTLIEMIITISIIAILTALSAVAMQGSRQSGRDARRQGDLSQIANGIEIYKSDCNFYPNAANVNNPGGSLTGVAPCNPVNANVYIQAIPDDPDAAGRAYVYSPTPAGCAGNCTGFTIWASLENPPTLPGYCNPNPGGCGGTGCNFCLINP